MGLADKFDPDAKLPKVPGFYREHRKIQMTREVERIIALPIRDWEEYDIQQAREWINDAFRISKDMELWDHQVAALVDIARYEGAFLPIGVGQGKSIVSLLACNILQAERPLLIVPAALRDQTTKYVIPEMRKIWKIDPKLKIISYTELSQEKNKLLLDRMSPDLIILDECHNVKNKTSGRTKRLIRYFQKHRYTQCVAMSGTVCAKSIHDYAHILEWCVGGMTPLPRTYFELKDWSELLDPGAEGNIRPGALEKIFPCEGTIREKFQRRFRSTPGIVATTSDSIGNALVIRGTTKVKPPEVVKKALDLLRNTWTTPNGDPCTEAVDVWRHVRELVCGFYYRWEPYPPDEWLKARKAWKAFVRDTLKYNKRQLDTELMVWNECAKNEGPDEFLRWREIKDTFELKTVPEWLDEYMIQRCKAWLDYQSTKHRAGRNGIVWVEHTAFGQKLAEVSGHRYFGAGDDSILKCKDQAIIASIRAHGEGKNLQRWSNNLIVAPPSSAKVWEQLLARTHRAGQDADEVNVEVMLHIPEFIEVFQRAIHNARVLEETYGNRQKLVYADKVYDYI